MSVTHCKSSRRFNEWFIILRAIYGNNIRKFCSETTLHALKYIGNTNLHIIERLYFVASFFFVLCGSSYFVANVFVYWRTSPIIIGADPKPNYITDDPFPAITICNLNQADKSKVQNFPIISQDYARLQMLCKRSVNGSVVNTITDWSNIKDFIDTISQDCNSMVIDCKFGSKTIDCKEAFKPIITDEGLCCSFNMVHPKFIYRVQSNYRAFFNTTDTAVNWNPEMGYPLKLPKTFFPRQTPGIGQSLGLSLILNVEADQYYCSSMNSVGFKMLLHNPVEIPSLRDIGLLVSPGHESLVHITPQRTTSLPELKNVDTQFRNCFFQDEHWLRNFKYYSISSCQMNCLAYMLLENCNCVPYFLPPLHINDSICSIYSSTCVENTRLEAIRPLANQTSCMIDCLPACYDLSYQANVFTTALSHSGFKISNKVVGNISNNYVEKNIAIVHLFFSELTYRAQKQKLIFGTTDFLSGIGGLMGLFFGFSFISIVELVYFLIFSPVHDLFTAFKRKSKRNERQVISRKITPLIKFKTKFTPIKYGNKKVFNPTNQLGWLN